MQATITEENRRFSITGTGCVRCGEAIPYWRTSCKACWNNHRKEVLAIKSLVE